MRPIADYESGSCAIPRAEKLLCKLASGQCGGENIVDGQKICYYFSFSSPYAEKLQLWYL